VIARIKADVSTQLREINPELFADWSELPDYDYGQPKVDTSNTEYATIIEGGKIYFGQAKRGPNEILVRHGRGSDVWLSGRYVYEGWFRSELDPCKDNTIPGYRLTPKTSFNFDSKPFVPSK